MKSNTPLRYFLSLLAGVAIAHGETPADFQTFREIRRLQADAQMKILANDHEDAADIFLQVADLESSRAKKAAAILQAADQFMLADEGNRALENYKNVLQNHSLYAPHDHVVRQLRKLAENFVIGKGTFLSLRDVNGAIKIYELIIREAPAAHVSNQDRFRLAELLRLEDRPEEAVAIYQSIVKKELRNWDARTELAIVLAQLAGISDGDGTKTRAAVREAKLVLAYKPDHPKANQLNELIANAHELTAQRLLEQAEFYLGRSHRRPAAARRYLHDVILKYPSSKAAKKADQLLKTVPILVKLEQNPQATPETQKPQVKAQPKPQVKAQPKPQVKAQPKPQVKAQPKPQVKAQPKPQVKLGNAQKAADTHTPNQAETDRHEQTKPQPAFKQPTPVRTDGKPAFEKRTSVRRDGKPAFTSHQRPRNDGRPAFDRPSPIRKDGKPAFDRPSSYVPRRQAKTGDAPKPAFDQPSPYYKLLHGMEKGKTPAKPAFAKPSQFHLDQQKKLGMPPRKPVSKPALPKQQQAQKVSQPLFQPVPVMSTPAEARPTQAKAMPRRLPTGPALPAKPGAIHTAKPIFTPHDPSHKTKKPIFQPTPIKSTKQP